MFSPIPCPCGCKKWIMSPYFGCQCSSVRTETKDELMAMARDAERYRWLRSQQSSSEAESMDKLCDRGIQEKL